MIAVGLPAFLLGCLFLDYDIKENGMKVHGRFGVLGGVLCTIGTVLLTIPAVEWMWVHLP